MIVASLWHLSVFFFISFYVTHMYILVALCFQHWLWYWCFYGATCLRCLACFKRRDDPCHIIETACCALMRKTENIFSLESGLRAALCISKPKLHIDCYWKVIKVIWGSSKKKHSVSEEESWHISIISETNHWEQKYVKKLQGRNTLTFKTAFRAVLCMVVLCVSCCWIFQNVHNWESLIKWHSSKFNDKYLEHLRGSCVASADSKQRQEVQHTNDHEN